MSSTTAMRKPPGSTKTASASPVAVHPSSRVFSGVGAASTSISISRQHNTDTTTGASPSATSEKRVTIATGNASGASLSPRNPLRDGSPLSTGIVNSRPSSPSITDHAPSPSSRKGATSHQPSQPATTRSSGVVTSRLFGQPYTTSSLALHHIKANTTTTRSTVSLGSEPYRVVQADERSPVRLVVTNSPPPSPVPPTISPPPVAQWAPFVPGRVHEGVLVTKTTIPTIPLGTTTTSSPMSVNASITATLVEPPQMHMWCVEDDVKLVELDPSLEPATSSGRSCGVSSSAGTNGIGGGVKKGLSQQLLARSNLVLREVTLSSPSSSQPPPPSSTSTTHHNAQLGLFYMKKLVAWSPPTLKEASISLREQEAVKLNQRHQGYNVDLSSPAMIPHPLLEVAAETLRAGGVNVRDSSHFNNSFVNNHTDNNNNNTHSLLDAFQMEVLQRFRRPVYYGIVRRPVPEEEYQGHLQRYLAECSSNRASATLTSMAGGSGGDASRSHQNPQHQNQATPPARYFEKLVALPTHLSSDCVHNVAFVPSHVCFKAGEALLDSNYSINTTATPSSSSSRREEVPSAVWTAWSHQRTDRHDPSSAPLMHGESPLDYVVVDVAGGAPCTQRLHIFDADSKDLVHTLELPWHMSQLVDAMEGGNGGIVPLLTGLGVSTSTVPLLGGSDNLQNTAASPPGASTNSQAQPSAVVIPNINGFNGSLPRPFMVFSERAQRMITVSCVLGFDGTLQFMVCAWQLHAPYRLTDYVVLPKAAVDTVGGHVSDSAVTKPPVVTSSNQNQRSSTRLSSSRGSVFGSTHMSGGGEAGSSSTQRSRRGATLPTQASLCQSRLGPDSSLCYPIIDVSITEVTSTTDSTTTSTGGKYLVVTAFNLQSTVLQLLSPLEAPSSSSGRRHSLKLLATLSPSESVAALLSAPAMFTHRRNALSTTGDHHATTAEGAVRQLVAAAVKDWCPTGDELDALCAQDYSVSVRIEAELGKGNANAAIASQAGTRRAMRNQVAANSSTPRRATTPPASTTTARSQTPQPHSRVSNANVSLDFERAALLSGNADVASMAITSSSSGGHLEDPSTSLPEYLRTTLPPKISLTEHRRRAQIANTLAAVLGARATAEEERHSLIPNHYLSAYQQQQQQPSMMTSMRIDGTSNTASPIITSPSGNHPSPCHYPYNAPSTSSRPHHQPNHSSSDLAMVHSSLSRPASLILEPGSRGNRKSNTGGDDSVGEISMEVGVVVSGGSGVVRRRPSGGLTTTILPADNFVTRAMSAMCRKTQILLLVRYFHSWRRKRSECPALQWQGRAVLPPLRGPLAAKRGANITAHSLLVVPVSLLFGDLFNVCANEFRRRLHMSLDYTGPKLPPPHFSRLSRLLKAHLFPDVPYSPPGGAGGISGGESGYTSFSQLLSSIPPPPSLHPMLPDELADKYPLSAALLTHSAVESLRMLFTACRRAGVSLWVSVPEEDLNLMAVTPIFPQKSPSNTTGSGHSNGAGGLEDALAVSSLALDDASNNLTYWSVYTKLLHEIDGATSCVGCTVALPSTGLIPTTNPVHVANRLISNHHAQGSSRNVPEIPQNRNVRFVEAFKSASKVHRHAFAEMERRSSDTASTTSIKSNRAAFINAMVEAEAALAQTLQQDVRLPEVTNGIDVLMLHPTVWHSQCLRVHTSGPKKSVGGLDGGVTELGEGGTTSSSTQPRLFERRQVRSLYVPTLTSEVAIASTLSEIHHRHTTAAMEGGSSSSYSGNSSVHPLLPPFNATKHCSERSRLDFLDATATLIARCVSVKIEEERFLVQRGSSAASYSHGRPRHGSSSQGGVGLDLHVSSQHCTNRENGHGSFWDPVFAHFTNNTHQGESLPTTSLSSTLANKTATTTTTTSSPYYTSPSARMLANDATTLVKTVRERSFTGENFVDLLSLQLPGSD